MGMFDDLIPKQAGPVQTPQPTTPAAPTTGMFADLIPQAQSPTAPANPAETVTQQRANMSMISPALEQGLTQGLSDELAGLARAPRGIPEAIKTRSFTPITEAYKSGQQDEAQRIAQYRAGNPKSATAQEILGGMVSLGGAETSNLQSLNPYVRAAAEGAGVGAIGGLGYSEPGEKAKGIATGAATGAIAGPIVHGLSEAAKSFYKAATPTLENLKSEAQKIYNQADNVGLVVSANSLQTEAQTLRNTLTQEGFHPRLAPRIEVALNEMESASSADQPLRMLQNLRRIAQTAGQSAQPDERRLGQSLLENFDNYLETLTPQDVITGDPQKAAGLLGQARTLWSRFRKGEMIHNLIENAKLTAPNYSASGMENSLRAQFRNMAKNPNQMRRFTPEEQAAIQKVAKGGPITNTMRYLGKLAPHGSLSMWLGLGGAIAAPQVAIPAMVGGEIMRQGAALSTKGAATAAEELARRGGPAVTTAAGESASGALQRMLQGAVPATKDVLQNGQ